MSIYLMQGKFPLRDGIMQNCPNPEDQGVLVSWGFWSMPTAANDDQMTPPPSYA